MTVRAGVAVFLTACSSPRAPFTCRALNDTTRQVALHSSVAAIWPTPSAARGLRVRVTADTVVLITGTPTPADTLRITANDGLYRVIPSNCR